MAKFCDTPSTATPTPSARGFLLGKSCSAASLCSRGTLLSRASSEHTLGTIHERRSLGAERPRRFSSRHVPSVAEDIVNSELLTPSMETRFNGLMKHLKNNSALEESQKQLLTRGAPESLVPGRAERTLRDAFEARCAFGERMNLELMGSAKWVKLLEDIGIIVPNTCAADAQASSPAPPPSLGCVDGELAKRTLSRAGADVIFHRVLHNCNYGGQRLDYELFCKALLLTGHVLWPEEDPEHVLTQLVDRATAATPAVPACEVQDLMSDANALLVLSHFKPTLHDLFEACCSQNLINPGNGCHGKGAVRIQERPILKSMRGSLTARGLDRTSMLHAFSQSLADATQLNITDDGKAGVPAGESFKPISSRWACSETIGRTLAAITQASYVEAQQPSARVANGTPVIANRRRLMSSEQFLAVCKQLKIMPDLLTRAAVVRVFKRAETACVPEGQSSGLHGYLTQEAFVNAAGQLAIEAYSKEPFCDEYPEVQDKIHAFLSAALPSKVRHVHDRFLYGRGW